MSEKAALRAIPSSRVKEAASQMDWLPSSTQIVIGKDILELLSTSMYIDPMTIYREYVQNAADSIDEARDQGMHGPTESGRVDISIDQTARSVRIRDNGTGVPWPQFAARLSNLGASRKRGTAARGFRGVGRLAGLGYCQELIFRSRGANEQLVSELRWDCRKLRSALRNAQAAQHLIDLMQDLLSVRRISSNGQPARFFEVELTGVIRHRDDRLLSPVAVRDYLAQVAPVPFSPDFKFGSEISAALKPHVTLGDLEIRVNCAEEPICRPHRNAIEIADRKFDKFTGLEIKELADIDGRVAGIAWVLHHGYYGALPSKTLIKGIRLRTGNVQVGDHTLLEDMFPETRFNGWAVGEVHVVDNKVLPNGRRDNFEQSTHFDNLLNQLTPIVREIAKHCRDNSIGRKWVREFEAHKTAAIDKAKAVSRGGISRITRQSYIDGVAKSLKAMRKVVATRYIGDDTRSDLLVEADATEARVARLLGTHATASDPLARYKPSTRAAYQRMIDLIYECTRNTDVAGALVEKILVRLSEEEKPSAREKRSRKRGSPQAK